jgi:putative membrane protein
MKRKHTEHVFVPTLRRHDDPEDAEALLEVRRTDLSLEQTQLSLQRTVWAAERTLAAWLRTGLATVVAGLAVFQFVHSAVGWVPPAVAGILVLTGVGMYGYGVTRYAQDARRLDAAGAHATPVRYVMVLVAPLVVAAVISLLLAYR